MECIGIDLIMDNGLLGIVLNMCYVGGLGFEGHVLEILGRFVWIFRCGKWHV